MSRSVRSLAAGVGRAGGEEGALAARVEEEAAAERAARAGAAAAREAAARGWAKE